MTPNSNWSPGEYAATLHFYKPTLCPAQAISKSPAETEQADLRGLFRGDSAELVGRASLAYRISQFIEGEGVKSHSRH